MNIRTTVLALVAILFLSGLPLRADTHYVATNGAAVSPYTSWVTAADDLQDAITAASDYDTIVISNGVYYPSASIAVNKSLYITSMTGELDDATNTVFDGMSQALAGFRFSGNTTSTLCGITITNYHIAGGGGGVYVYSPGHVVDGNFISILNCLITGNSNATGGGIEVYSGTMWASNCIIRGNDARSALAGGGVQFYSGRECTGRLDNCVITDNRAVGQGGGVYCGKPVTIANCTIVSNSATSSGGGVRLQGHISNSKIMYNTASSGAGVYGGSTINNCLIAHNISSGIGGGTYNALVRNCTVVSNTGSRGGGTRGCVCINTIIYHNTATDAANLWSSNRYGWDGSAWTNCCTAPEPTDGAPWVSCITSNPLFESTYPYNFRPLPESPCVNAGLNESWLLNVKDLDNHTRIAEYVVDMGAYEYHPPGTVILFK